MILFFLSLLIVAFGQPVWLKGFLSPLAAFCGYAIFWRHYQSRFWPATWWFTCVQLIQLSWMTSIEFQGAYILFFYVGIAFWLGMQFGLLTFFVKKRMTFSRMLAIAAFWTLMEWGRTQILCGFSFNPVGMSLASFVPSMQGAALFGVWGLSFYVIFTNLVCLQKRINLALLLAIMPYAAGAVYLQTASEERDPALKIALVQTGLLPSQKTPLRGKTASFISPYEQWHQIARNLREQRHQDWDLIVLPESVVPFLADQPVYRFDIVKNILNQEGIQVLESANPSYVSNLFWVQTLSSHFQADFIAGLDAEDDSKGEYYAAAYSVSANKQQIERYEKRVLVPLAEYLPFLFLKPFVAAYGIKNFFQPGKEAKLFTSPVPLAVSICYEETFPHLIREGRLKGATLFVNLTNDNWYPNSILARQHFDLGRLRAVENGVSVVRACNSGVTAAIDRFGRIKALLEENAGVLTAFVEKRHHYTPYVLWGDWGILSLSLICLLWAACQFYSKKLIFNPVA